MSELNHLYLSHPALSAADYEPDGFCWLDCHQENRCIYAIQRTDGDECLIGILNLSGHLPRKTISFLCSSPILQYFCFIRTGSVSMAESRKRSCHGLWKRIPAVFLFRLFPGSCLRSQSDLSLFFSCIRFCLKQAHLMPGFYTLLFPGDFFFQKSAGQIS